MSHVVESNLNAFQSIGFDIHPFGNNTFVIHGVPAGTEEHDTTILLEQVLQTFNENEQELHLKPLENMARSLAKRAAVKPGKSLTAQEMNGLLQQLFHCEQPAFSADGKPVFVSITADEIDKRMKR
jgi:DNA mismatch repair protein MutL